MSTTTRGNIPGGNGLQPTARARTPSGPRRITPEPTNHVNALSSKGVTETNKTDLSTLVSVLESWGDFRETNNSNSRTLIRLSAELADQLQAVTALLRQAIPTRAQLTKGDLIDAIQEIKTAIQSESSTQRQTYAQIVGSHNSTQNVTVYSKPKPQSDLKEKQLFVSTRLIDKAADVMILTPTELKKQCNNILTTFFKESQNGAVDMQEPIRGISRSAAGNLTFTFHRSQDVDKARLHSEWVTRVDPRLHIPQRLYPVVAHNAPTDAWNGEQSALHDATKAIETENSSSTTAYEYSITSLTWLNGVEARKESKRGPLLINFKSKKDANNAIDTGLSFNGEMCNVSIYVPRAPQCFRCQDWGHRATECTGEARCGRCAGNHETSAHRCTHSASCTAGPTCSLDPKKCANCGAAHASWIRTCPKAKAAFQAQVNRDEYRSGRYEPHTPFTLADSLFKTQNKQRRDRVQRRGSDDQSESDPFSTPTPTHEWGQGPQIDIIPATSPVIPNVNT
jgi:hypothetical protein